MVVGFFGNLIRIAITPMVGRMGDRYGMACIYKYSLVGILLNFAFMALSVPSNAYPMTIAATIFSAIGWSFAGIGLFGIQLELINEEKRTLQLSILSSIGGVYGFLVSFLAGRLLSHLQHTPLILAGAPSTPNKSPTPWASSSSPPSSSTPNSSSKKEKPNSTPNPSPTPPPLSLALYLLPFAFIPCP